MITLNFAKIKTLEQKTYDNFLNDINVSSLLCTCGIAGCLTKHAYYYRSLKILDVLIKLSILRVKCSHCGKTHALLPSLIVPYSQVALNEQITILKTYVSKASFEPIMLKNEYIDESNIRYIIRQFLCHWKERIAAFGFSLCEFTDTISSKCFKYFNRQFMQIKRTPNILFN